MAYSLISKAASPISSPSPNPIKFRPISKIKIKTNREKNCQSFSPYILYKNTNKIIQMAQSHKNIQLIKCLKSCIQQTLLLYKACQALPTPLDNAKDVSEYAQNLQKLLQNIVDYIPKNMIALQNYNKLKQQQNGLNNQLTRLLHLNKEYRCELDVANIKLAELQASERKLLEDRAREKRYSLEFQNKLERIRKDSEEGLKKIIQTSKNKEINSYDRKQSLPSIHTYANREKLGLLLLMSQPAHKPPKRSLIEAFKKY